MAIVSTFTLDLLSPYVVVEGFKRGLAIQPMFAPHGQLEQQVLDAGSATYRWNPDVVMLAVRAEEAMPALMHGFLALERGSIDNEVTAPVERIVSLIRAIRERSHAFVIVWNQVLPRRLAAGLADMSLDLSQGDAMEMVNGRLAETCRQLPGVQLFDARRVANEIGLNAWEDLKLSFLARAPLATGAHVAVARRLARMLRTSSACRRVTCRRPRVTRQSKVGTRWRTYISSWRWKRNSKSPTVSRRRWN